MSDIVWWNVLVSAGIGLVLLLALWPSPARATRLLRRWGVPDPDERGQAEALRYLKRRRFVYPWLYVGSSLLFSATGLAGSGWSSIMVSLLVGAVLAELLAQRPPRGARREAALTERGVRDLLPTWSRVVWGVVVVVGVGIPVLAMIGTPLIRVPEPWPVLAIAAGAAATGAVIVWLTVRRPPAVLDRADEALRLRSARVGLGLSMAALGSTAVGWDGTSLGGGIPGLALFMVGLGSWILITSSVRANEAAATP